jgi:hypothetical protein
MKPTIAIPLGVAGILSAIGTAFANANGLFVGHPSLAYWFWGASFALIAFAIVGSVVNSKREKKNDSPLSTPPPVQVHQENKQEFNPQFNPQIVIGDQDHASVTAKLQSARNDGAVLAFMKKTNPTEPFKVDGIAEGVTLNNRDAWDALERLERKGIVRRLRTGDAVGGALWFLNELDR